ncbi:MAG TPA: UDP-N-acetylglucosamine 2-epimerase (non-hydrolyzing) [Bryobacteraceae bacterium]|nr:UDP-N-acetylglucosamine 2-epimerase (non-hydrolyzing) [Bryobacteraceae bacterium]
MTSPKVASLTGTNSLPNKTAATPKRVLLIFGTRPEAIKLCPLVGTLRNISFNVHLEPVVCVTGQHREMLDQVLEIFGVRPDFDLAIMQQGQTLPELTARLLQALPPVLEKVQPSLTIVQGDTTTTLCGALAAFYAGIPVAHVEAGLRTFNFRSPFPEEMNRVLATRLTTLHFAATSGAADHLLREGVPPASIQVTGNTGIDAVLAVRDRLEAGTHSGLTVPLDPARKLIVVTAHRRESFGHGFEKICRAIAQLADRADVQIVWPVHRNPNVLKPVDALLRGHPNITLIDPLEYLPFVDLMRRAYLIITDSGGVQEEAPSLGKPVLVLRDTTERPEAVAAGTVRLVGTDPAKIVAESLYLLDNPAEYRRMSEVHNPYGDGQACGRITQAIASHLSIPLP